VEQRDRRAIAVLSSAKKSGTRHDRAHSLRLRDGMIADVVPGVSPPLSSSLYVQGLLCISAPPDTVRTGGFPRIKLVARRGQAEEADAIAHRGVDLGKSIDDIYYARFPTFSRTRRR
jgi:hypothetical protein